MNPGALFIGLAMLVITVPYVINPLINERKRQPIRTSALKKPAALPYADALTALRDLDFDFQIGKVTPEDYESLRARLVVEAAEYLTTKQQEEEKIETMIRNRLQAAKPSARCTKCGGIIRPQDLFCPTCGVAAKDQTASNEPVPQATCPVCGKNVRDADLYCTGCGTRVNEKLTA